MDRDLRELESLEAEGLLRHARRWRREGAEIFDSEGSAYVDFSSNDYLGLSQHPLLIEGAKVAIERYGVGSTASRLISGTSAAHEECEATLAYFKGSESALLFSTGMMAAHGTIKALFREGDTIILDKLSHACLVDAARECGARLRVFPHNNLNKLESLLKSERERLVGEGRILVIVESVYSMDGDLCPLAEIVRLKEEYNAMLLVDEAHGLGVLGSKGMGLADELGLQSRIDLQMGTLGKAAGGAGGYIACSQVLRDLIVNKGRSFIYTTSPPPSQAAVAAMALDLIASDEGALVRQKLSNNRALLAKLIEQEVPTAICPIILGENQVAIEASERLCKAGYYVPAVRYPTVAKGSARLRLTLTALHDEVAIRGLCTAL